MDEMLIEGGVPLKGRVKVSGAKNAALPLMAASLLTDEQVVLEGVPDLKDVRTMGQILVGLGSKVTRDGETLILRTGPGGSSAPYELVKTMRASIAVLGPLLAKRKQAEVALPGGCVIGPRPIDLHLKGMEALGAAVTLDHGNVIATTQGLVGADIFLGGGFGSSVLATANVLMAAVLAKGVTRIESAAAEPEVEDLVALLTKMGAKIKGAGGHLLEVEGVKTLGGATHRIIPDRIEAGTFLVAGAMTGGDLEVEGFVWEHLFAVVEKLKVMGVSLERTKKGARVRSSGRPRPTEITTMPYPGFPTDLQAQFMAHLTLADGVSVIAEKIYPERFIHVGELNRMGAKITRDNAQAVVTGVEQLSGAPVMASDLRASAALVLAGLAAKGETMIQRIYHLDRGYEKMMEKFGALGAKVRRRSRPTQG